MTGLNKWFIVQRIKGVIDAQQGKLFSRLAKEIAAPNVHPNFEFPAEVLAPFFVRHQFPEQHHGR